MALAVRSVMDDTATIQAAFDSPEAARTAADELRRCGLEPRVDGTTLEMNGSPDAQAMLQRLGANLRNVAMADEERHLSSDSPALAHDPLVPGS